MKNGKHHTELEQPVSNWHQNMVSDYRKSLERHSLVGLTLCERGLEFLFLLLQWFKRVSKQSSGKRWPSSELAKGSMSYSLLSYIQSFFL